MRQIVFFLHSIECLSARNIAVWFGPAKHTPLKLYKLFKQVNIQIKEEVKGREKDVYI